MFSCKLSKKNFLGQAGSRWHRALPVPSSCRKFEISLRKQVPEQALKVPHMGWNRVNLRKPSALTKGIPDGSYFYFVHSYYLETQKRFVVGQTDYDVSFPAIVQKQNFYGTQFHPEKSGKWGEKLLNNFCEL